MSLSGSRQARILGNQKFNDFDINLRGNKLSRFGKTQIAGNNKLVPTTETTVAIGMPVNLINRITFPSSSAIMAIASTSANDTAAGTGARTVLISYLDTNFHSQTETITLNGTTKVATTNSMYRINTLIVLTAGTTGSNEGNLYIGLNSDTFTGGAPDTEVFHTVGLGDNISFCGTHTFSANKNYIVRIDGSTDATANKVYTSRVYIRSPGGLNVKGSEDYFTTGALSEILTLGGAVVAKGVDLEITGQVSNGTGRGTFFYTFYTED